MTQFLLVVAVALTVGAIVFGITVLVTGDDDGLRPVEPDGRALPLPPDRPLTESDVAQVRFDTALRGYRMAQVDAALRRAAYDIGYKDELIDVLQAEVRALREGRFPDAEVLRRAREAALAAATAGRPGASPADAGEQPPEDPDLPAMADRPGSPDELAVAGESAVAEEPDGAQAVGAQAVGAPAGAAEAGEARPAAGGAEAPDRAGEAPDGAHAEAPDGAHAEAPDGAGAGAPDPSGPRGETLRDGETVPDETTIPGRR